METLREDPEYRISAMFKSYYVVWKLIIIVFFFHACEQFKSYYVVWKPPREKKEEVGEEEFKSYYVVWKRV